MQEIGGAAMRTQAAIGTALDSLLYPKAARRRRV